ncbi:hypothetical protein [Confluentibacter sediminis]|uniref:hypothetical protein n=1 Tax=Confluentibacter sediminis TaxID=2219045 RepID=UPI000DAC5BBB|nr:hypothetical protein [Confluentibacter sediminis]
MASITQLSLFNKDTDAFATERGYEYQKLKTLESWLLNSIHKSDEIIYYDFEEDIFHRDLTKLKSTFRQIKLYSSNFSFASVEIRKTISHFFTLFCLGDYLLDEIIFVFEANSNIARKHGNNDAKLLKDWHDNQDELMEPLLSKCVKICKEIVTEFVESQDDSRPELAAAKVKFEELKSNTDFWNEFVKSINWKFQGVGPEEAMVKSLKEIESLINQLPFPIKTSDIDSVIHSLHFHISQCATKESPEDRLLNAQLLEHKVLSLLGDSEKWYGEQLGKWRGFEGVKEFRLGELYEIIAISRFYRQHQELDGHREIWSEILVTYLNLADLPEFCEKDIIYELIFLKLRPTKSFKFHDPDTTDIVSLTNRYFQIVPKSVNDPLTIEESVNIYSIIRSANHVFESINIDKATFDKWLNDMENVILLKLKTAKVNTNCSYLESLSMIEFNLKNWDDENKIKGYTKAISILKQIVAVSGEAGQYNYSNLLIRINEFLRAFFKLGLSEEYPEVINELEDISTDLASIVSKREANFSLAVQFRTRGIDYLKYSKNSKDMLRSFDYFHRAKALLFKNETKDSFVLVLLNICQVYMGIGFNYAAKYYALAAFFYSIQDEELFKRVTKSVSFICKIDFQNGTWFNFLMDYEKFIVFTGELNPEWDINVNADLREVLLDYAFVLYSIPYIGPELGVLVNHQIKELGWVKEEYMDMFIDGLSENLKTKDEVIRLARSKLVDFPLNDIGKERNIQFNAYGVTWNIQFENNYKSCSNGEEFCAILQILLSELKTHFPDFQIIDEVKNIQFNLLEGDSLIPPKKINNFEWEVSLPMVKKPKPYYPFIMGIIVSIFKEIIDDDKDVMSFFIDLQKDKDLDSKATIIKPYDDLYKDLYSKDLYNKFMRDGFNKVITDVNFIIKNNVID